MAAPVLLGTSSVPYSPVSPSPSALQLSADGQYCICTRGELNLFTPALGFTSGTSAPGAGAPAPAQATGGGKGKEKEKAKERVELPLLRTVIPIEKKNMVKWSDWGDEYDLVMPGSVDTWWRAASWSPSGLSNLGGCVLATLTTNGEVLLFAPTKDAHKGEWNETCDVTALLIQETMPQDDAARSEATPEMRRETVANIRRCRTSAISWSHPVAGYATDYSLLALGHRSGEVSLWRYDPSGTLKLVHRFRPAGEVNWINVLSWSSWTVALSDINRTATASLALADADGRVFTVEISQALSSIAEEPGTAETLLVAKADRRGATQLLWIEHESTRQLVFTKLGTVSVATLARDELRDAGWTVEKTEEVELRTEGAEGWMGATSWAPCSGLSYLPSTSTLLVSLSSSSLHLLTLSPTLTYSTAKSEAATSASRNLFDVVLARSRGQKERFSSDAKGKVTRKEGAKVLGFVGLGSGKEGLDAAVIYETERPSAFTHRTASGTRTYLSIGSLAPGEMSEDEAARELEGIVNSPLNARLRSPLSQLQPLLAHLANHASDAALLDALLTQLHALPLPPSPGRGERLSSVAEQVLKALFGEAGIEGCRMKEIVARALTKHPIPASHQHAALLAHTNLARQLIKEVLSRIASTIGAIPLSDSEKPLHARLLLASSSLHPPLDDLHISEGAELVPPDALVQAYQGEETCPACRASVPLENVRFATCEGGHRWERCSLTLTLVSTVQVRTCTACERKALLQLPGSDGSGVVNEMLKKAACCAYCGGRWMRVR
ncbi:hypothetical protein JCM10213_004086 [Rhodosporidiobolus nylandii]